MASKNRTHAAANGTGAPHACQASRRNTNTNRSGDRARKCDAALDFAAITRTTLPVLLALLLRWLPDGRREGNEYLALNPRRTDRHPGSFKVNLQTGRWSDFATGDKGGDPISLVAYLFDTSQAEAARRLATMLGVP